MAISKYSLLNKPEKEKMPRLFMEHEAGLREKVPCPHFQGLQVRSHQTQFRSSRLLSKRSSLPRRTIKSSITPCEYNTKSKTTTASISLISAVSGAMLFSQEQQHVQHGKLRFENEAFSIYNYKTNTLEVLK